MLKSDNTIIHSLVYYDNLFYDILGHYNNKEKIINNWNNLFMTDEDLYLTKMKNIRELSLEDYDEEEHEEAKNFVETEYIPKLIKLSIIQ